MNDSLLILVIEDSDRIRKMLADALESGGFHAMEARTAMEGVRLARARRPDVIVVDLGLPDQDGGVTISCLKDYEGFETIPVVLISGMSEEELRGRAMEMGAVSFLRKPFAPRVLLDCVKQITARDVG